MKIKKRPKKEGLAELTKWYQKRDYSVFIGMTVGKFISELEERLNLYWLALRSDGSCFTDERWLKIYLRDSVVITSSHLSNTNTPEVPGISIVRKEYLPLLVKACGLKQNKQEVGSPFTVTKQGSAEYRVEAEKFQQQMAEAKEKIDFDEYMPDTREKSAAKANDQMVKFKELVAKKNQMIADKDHEPVSEKERLMFKEDYLFSIGADEQKLVLTIDVKNFTKQELVEQFSYLLEDTFQRFGIEEAEGTLKTGKLTSLNSFLSHYAIQYLDLLIYCLIEPITIKDTDYVWEAEDTEVTIETERKHLKLTDRNIAELLNKNDLDAVDISQWKKDFYKPKLLDGEYMLRFFDVIKSDPENLRERVQLKESRKNK